jgi:hypothetical protein
MNDPARDLDPTRLARVDWSRGLLREAVFQSRAKQAAGASLVRKDVGAGARNCGLGDHAAVVLELSEAGRKFAEQLWPVALSEPAAVRVQALLTAWIERQDAIDRERNHFLRDFRKANGFDRAKYSPQQLVAFEAGLERVNLEENRLASEAARELASLE